MTATLSRAACTAALAALLVCEAASGQSCPRTLAHLNDKLPRYDDAVLRQIRDAAITTDLQSVLANARSMGYSPQRAAAETLEAARQAEAAMPEAESCVRGFAASPEQALGQLRNGTFRFDGRSATADCVRAYVMSYYAMVTNRETATGLACWAAGGSAAPTASRGQSPPGQPASNAPAIAPAPVAPATSGDELPAQVRADLLANQIRAAATTKGQPSTVLDLIAQYEKTGITVPADVRMQEITAAKATGNLGHEIRAYKKFFNVASRNDARYAPALQRYATLESTIEQTKVKRAQDLFARAQRHQQVGNNALADYWLSIARGDSRRLPTGAVDTLQQKIDAAIAGRSKEVAQATLQSLKFADVPAGTVRGYRFTAISGDSLKHKFGVEASELDVPPLRVTEPLQASLPTSRNQPFNEYCRAIAKIKTMDAAIARGAYAINADGSVTKSSNGNGIRSADAFAAAGHHCIEQTYDIDELLNWINAGSGTQLRVVALAELARALASEGVTAAQLESTVRTAFRDRKAAPLSDAESQLMIEWNRRVGCTRDPFPSTGYPLIGALMMLQLPLDTRVAGFEGEVLRFQFCTSFRLTDLPKRKYALSQPDAEAASARILPRISMSLATLKKPIFQETTTNRGIGAEVAAATGVYWFRAQDVILKVNDLDIDSPADATRAADSIAQGKPVTTVLLRDGELTRIVD